MRWAETDLFVYQEKARHIRFGMWCHGLTKKMRKTKNEGSLPGGPWLWPPFCSLRCQILNGHPAFQLDLFEEVSDRIQVKMGCTKQNAFNLFLGGGGEPVLEGALFL